MRTITTAGEVEVEVYASQVDGVLIVQIDTEPGNGRLRIYLNDGTIWDGDPETHHHDDCQCAATRLETHSPN